MNDKSQLSLTTNPVASKSSSASSVSHNFAAGDMVEVSEGELINLCGKIIRIDGNKITMLPKHKELTVRGFLYNFFLFFSTNHCL